MLHVILIILKIIGITLLVIIGLLVLAVLLVLFVPVRYRLQGRYKKPAETKSFEAGAIAKVTWLLHFISVKFSYSDGIGYIVRVLGFPLVRGGTEEKKKRKKKNGEEESSQESSQESTEDSSADSSAEAKAGDEEEAESEGETDIKSEDDAVEGSGDGEEDDSEPASDSEDKKEKSVVNKLKNSYNKVTGMLSDRRVNRAWELTKSQTARLFKAVMPRRANGHFYYGFEDPSITGYLTALFAANLRRVHKLDIVPYFEDEILDADIKASGRIFAITMLLIAGKMYFNKDVRYTMDAVNELRS